MKARGGMTGTPRLVSGGTGKSRMNFCSFTPHPKILYIWSAPKQKLTLWFFPHALKSVAFYNKMETKQRLFPFLGH